MSSVAWAGEVRSGVPSEWGVVAVTRCGSGTGEPQRIVCVYEASEKTSSPGNR
jgi:hypothetical protein